MKNKNIVFIVAIILSVLISVITLFFRYQNEKSQTILNLSMDQKLSDFDELCDIEEYKNAETADQAEKTSALTTSIFEDKKAAYLKIQSFELTNYEKDKDVLTKFFVEIKDIPNLIIDLRGNSGGSDLYWKDLLIQPNTKESLSSDRYYVFNQTETTLGSIFYCRQSHLVFKWIKINLV